MILLCIYRWLNYETNLSMALTESKNTLPSHIAYISVALTAIITLALIVLAFLKWQNKKRSLVESPSSSQNNESIYDSIPKLDKIKYASNPEMNCLKKEKTFLSSIWSLLMTSCCKSFAIVKKSDISYNLRELPKINESSNYSIDPKMTSAGSLSNKNLPGSPVIPTPPRNSSDQVMPVDENITIKADNVRCQSEGQVSLMVDNVCTNHSVLEIIEAGDEIPADILKPIELGDEIQLENNIKEIRKKKACSKELHLDVTSNKATDQINFLNASTETASSKAANAKDSFYNTRIRQPVSLSALRPFQTTLASNYLNNTSRLQTGNTTRKMVLEKLENYHIYEHIDSSIDATGEYSSLRFSEQDKEK